MLEILLAGGWAMAPILLCSAVAVAIILERFWSLRRSTVIPANLGAEVREWARTRKLDPDHIEVLRKNSPLGELLAAALTVRNRPREIIKERVEDTGRHVVHRLALSQHARHYRADFAAIGSARHGVRPDQHVFCGHGQRCR